MIRRRAVPVEVIFHEIDALAGYGMGDDHHRLLYDGLSHLAGVDDGLNVVTVDFQHVPAESFPALAMVASLTGTQCPLDNTRISRSSQSGFSGLCLRTLK